MSTIIPVLNDAAALRICLAALQQCAYSEEDQIIVADGGACAECRELTREFGAAYVSSERGRAQQMNQAAENATGQWIWFLHADCEPARDSIAALMGLDSRTIWGCFRHCIDATGAALRVIETMDNLRARWGLPYGDQGIFVRADVFRSIRGFQAVPLLEDVLLARTLIELGAPHVLKPWLKTSARRWLQKGILRTMLTNWRIMFELDVLKRSPEELAKVYG